MADQVRRAWGQHAPRFAAEKAGEQDRPSMRRLVELCAAEPGSLVLDVATGAGFTAFAFVRRGCRVVALDPTHEMLQATQIGWPAGVPAAVVEGWAEALPFRDESFDAVVSHRAPHQFADPAAFVREARRVLRPGGAFAIADQSPPSGWETWHNDLERLRDPTHETALSPAQWQALVASAGLRFEHADVVYQSHDVQDWLDRVACPPDRQAAVIQALEQTPDAIRDVYRPSRLDGRLTMRTPQAVLLARR